MAAGVARRVQRSIDIALEDSGRLRELIEKPLDRLTRDRVELTLLELGFDQPVVIDCRIAGYKQVEVGTERCLPAGAEAG